MEPVLLIHGYSSDGKDSSMEDIYGTLPDNLREWLGTDQIRDINLSRWVSLNDGIRLDDVSFAMERALRNEAADLLESKTGFNVIIHSTGALVVRNWIRLYSPKPCPIKNLVHLAGTNFGSGLAHIGRGQLARWGRRLMGTGCCVEVLNEFEFGSWKTIDLHRFFLREDNDMYENYQVQEFCIAGSQIPSNLRKIPIRYVKEDSSDNTIRTSASNLNFNYIQILPTDDARTLSVDDVEAIIEQRLEDQEIPGQYYYSDLSGLCHSRHKIPFAIAYETAHYGKENGIVSGSANRDYVMPLINQALTTDHDESEYSQRVIDFDAERQRTFEKAGRLDDDSYNWNPQSQYEGHAQLIFRIRDQFGVAVNDFDINLNSNKENAELTALESCIEDRHLNRKHGGTMCFYLRTQAFKNDEWREIMDCIAPIDIEVTGTEPRSDDIRFLPLLLKLSSEQLRQLISSFKTTIIDIELLRLPAKNVFDTLKLPEQSF